MGLENRGSWQFPFSINYIKRAKALYSIIYSDFGLFNSFFLFLFFLFFFSRFYLCFLFLVFSFKYLLFICTYSINYSSLTNSYHIFTIIWQFILFTGLFFFFFFLFFAVCQFCLCSFCLFFDIFIYGYIVTLTQHIFIYFYIKIIEVSIF